MKQFYWLTRIFLPALIIPMLLLQACENDLNKVKQISTFEASKPIDTTTGVDVVYSDSAKVKARILTPLMLHFTPEKVGGIGDHYEMPKGVKIDFYDSKLNDKTPGFNADKHVIFVVTSNYAITSKDNKLVELRKNVVVKNPAGDVFTTEQLFYDAIKKSIYSNVACRLTKLDGTVLDGTSFTSNETFTDYQFFQGKGQIPTNGKLGQ